MRRFKKNSFPRLKEPHKKNWNIIEFENHVKERAEKLKIESFTVKKPDLKSCKYSNI